MGAESSFWYILVGNCLGGIAQPFLINPPAQLAAVWFRPDRVTNRQRTMATTVGSMAFPLGVAVGFLLPAVIVTDADNKSQVVLLMLVEAIISTVALGLVVILLKKEPKHPPSVSAAQKREEFWPALRKVAKNRSFLCLVVTFSMGQGAMNALATLIDLISKPYGYTESDNSIFGILLILCGLAGAGVIGFIVTKTRRYKNICILVSIGTLSSFIAFILTLSLKSIAITCAMVALMGFTLTPVMPISYELGAELTYPIGEAMIGGILNTGAQVVGIFEVGLSYLLQNQPMIINAICIAGIAIGVISLLFVEEKLNRADIEKVCELPEINEEKVIRSVIS